MDGNIDTVREALDYARRFSDNIGIEYRCNAALAALSAIDPEAIRRECAEKLSAMRTALGLAIHTAANFGRDHPALEDMLAGPSKIYHDSAAILSAEPAQERVQSTQCRKCRYYGTCTRPELQYAFHKCDGFKPEQADVTVTFDDKYGDELHELAQDDGKLPIGFNQNDPCDSCARKHGDPACLDCESIDGQVDSEWIPREIEPTQDAKSTLLKVGDSCPECGTVILASGYGAHHSAFCPMAGYRFVEPEQDDGKAEVGDAVVYFPIEARGKAVITQYEPWHKKEFGEFIVIMRAAEVKRKIEEAGR